MTDRRARTTVRVQVAGRHYNLTCAHGDEERLHHLVAQFDRQATRFAQQFPNTNDENILLMTALHLLDQPNAAALDFAAPSAPDRPDPAETGQPDPVATLLDGIADEIDAIAASLPNW